MKINKNSAVYKVGVVIFIILAVIYTIYTGSGEEGNVTDDSSVEMSADTSDDKQAVEDNNEDLDDTKYDLIFRNEELLKQHYEKHGIEMGFESAAEYAKAANKVLENVDTLHKVEAEDGDDVYYLEETNEFVVVSKDGYIRTYFNPDDGLDYFNRQ